MVAGMDYDALRAGAVPIGQDRAVTVNKRSLIDKQLSRYSRPWSTLRELIQNAADAEASQVVIKIKTTPSLRLPTPQSDDPSIHLRHVLHNHTVNEWVIGNNGHAFRPEDWARLQEIATGNPDEDKIGAFGVGFYSVFSISERPSVFSGSEALEFFWKENDLRAQRFKSPKNTDTIFQLPVHDTQTSVPHGHELFSLCQFLTGSMTFVGLQSIDLFIDQWRILHLQKSVADPVNLGLPPGLSRTTPKKLMRISQVTQQAVQLEVEWMNVLDSTPSLRSASDTLDVAKKSVFSFFKRTAGPFSQNSGRAGEDVKPVADAMVQDIIATSRHKAFFHVNKASISTTVDHELGAEYLRLRKKRPPKLTNLSLLAQSYEESTASHLNEPAVASKLFKSVVPDSKGHIYIGFTTSQTTGLSAHLEIPALVPTVEREQLDLNSKHIRTWNMELLRAAGLVARISWSAATTDLQDRLSRYPGMTDKKVLEPEELQEVLPAVKWQYESFDWSSTTPLHDVGRYIQDTFWDCAPDFSLFSSRGFVPMDNARVASADISFVEELATVPEPLLQLGLVQKLREGGVLVDVQIDDIIWVLENSKKTRTPAQLQRLLAYLTTRARAKTIDQREIRSILNATVASDNESTPTRIIALNEIKEYVNPDKIPPDMPVPPTTIPFKYTKTLSKFDTDALGFQELDSLKWVKWLVENADMQLPPEQNIETSSVFASNVLKTLGKAWPSMSPDAKSSMTTLLENRTVVPSKQGMKKPSETYFSSVKLFADLPVIIDNLSNVKEGFLSALGVRKTLEIGVVFDRLMSGSSRHWSHVDLIKYLVSVWDDVPSRDRERLMSTPVCPAEVVTGKPSGERYRISELYEPNDALRRLGLPILQWPGGYNPGGKEAKLLHTLGLRDAPPYTELVSIIATAGQTADISLQEFGLKYFFENSQSKGYNASAIAAVRTPFLPVQGSKDKLSAPADCFTNERAASLGFSLLRSDLHKYAVLFGVPSDPPIDRCIQRLTKKPPRTSRQAREMFGYMTSRIGVITNQHAEVLGGANIVPIISNKNATDDDGGRVRHLSPRMCFLGDGGELANMFDFVEFGKEAEMFLMRCGSKHEPSILDVAYLFTQQPAKLLNELSQARYLEVLIKMSTEWNNIKRDKPLVEKLKQASFLPATRVETSDQSMTLMDDDTKGDTKQWHLAKASDIVIIDDIGNYNLFKTHVLAALQQDEALERMYQQLGTPGLSSLVEERQKITGLDVGKQPDQMAAEKLQSIIRERARLFLYDYQKESLNHDSKWLEQNVKVQTVRSIVIKTSLKGTEITHVQEKTATLRQESTGGSWTICITEKYHMAQVSKALARLLLIRPKPRDWMVLTEFLRSELSSLQEAGINVERILRQREKEAEVAHGMHQRQLEQEQRARNEREALQRAMEAQGGRDGNVDGDVGIHESMPGDFPGSGNGKGRETGETEEPAGLFGGFRKMLGLDPARKPQATLPDGEPIGHDDARLTELEQPYSDLEQPLPPKSQKRFMTPQELNDLSQEALRSTRPYTPSTVKGQPSVHKVEEVHTTCDPRPGMNLIYAGEASHLRLFLDDGFIQTSGTSKEKFMAANHEGLRQFASVLLDCATIYKLPRESIHIFFDDYGETNAFNKGQRSLFFNYTIFRDHHLAMVEQGHRDLPVRFWAATTAHELAHNIEGDHNVRFMNIVANLTVTHLHRISEVARAGGLPPLSAGPASPPARQAASPQPARGPAPASRQAVPPPRQGVPKPPPKNAFGGAFKR